MTHGHADRPSAVAPDDTDTAVAYLASSIRAPVATGLQMGANHRHGDPSCGVCQDERRPPSTNRMRVRVEGKFLALGNSRLRLHGVTYGPFAPNSAGEPFPEPSRVSEDMAHMRATGVNCLRTYYPPPHWLFSLADEHGLHILVDVPWSKHLCFLDSREAQAEAREAVRRAAERGREHLSCVGYSIGNEIAPDVARWHGERRVERFLAELADVARQADPDGLVTYGNYPPTEYLELPSLDFLMFNVYLHDPAAFRRYIARLQNLAGERPLVLGELGMDSMREGEEAQADFIAGHLRESVLAGLAGTFVFAWTDDWFTGGHQIEDWAFGVTRTDRSPKPASHAMGRIYGSRPSELLDNTLRVSVVVCSYNGGATLEQCLASLGQVDYPDYEVILVDDGSTDATREIARRFPDVKAIHQANQGLSAARNVGLQASTGSIVAYTDSDCYADPDWLTHLVHQLRTTGAAAVGGPNISPEDGRVAACIDASPGQPTHVLEDDHVAEHIPGCNMAFDRDALAGIGGFDPTFRQAGDDVDVCWRLQEQGHWITYAPGALVWHHRRQTPRAYLRQQVGYGRAESLLRFKYPERFNNRGDGRWNGVVYGAHQGRLKLGKPKIQRGRFASGLFQCIYGTGASHWAMLPSTLEWHAAAGLFALGALFWPPAWALVAAMMGLSLAVAGVSASQVSLPSGQDGLASRLLVAVLSYAQPLARAWGRCAMRLAAYGEPKNGSHPPPIAASHRVPLRGCRSVGYWTESWRGRQEVLDRFVGLLEEEEWARTVDRVEALWDVLIHCDRWTALRVRTVEEDHGSGRRVIRARYCLRPTRLGRFVLTMAGLSFVAAIALGSVPAAVCGTVLVGVAAVTWWRGAIKASRAAGLLHRAATSLGLSELATTNGSEDDGEPAGDLVERADRSTSQQARA